MASASQSEDSPLLTRKHSAHSTSHHRNYASSSSLPLEEQDGEEAQSIFSHVSLDVTPTYGRLVGSHILSLLPGLALQLAAVMLAFHAPCHIHYKPDDRHGDRMICRRLLSDWMSMTAFTLGLLSWLAAYSFRPAISKVVEWGSWMIQSNRGQVEDESGDQQHIRSSSSITSTLIFVLLRTSVLECIRMFSVMVINAVLFAGLAHLQDQGKAGSGDNEPDPRWYLEWYDPRFTVGLWVAIGWCVTEFVVSTFQMMDRLTLYKTLFDDGANVEEGQQPSPAYTPHIDGFTDTQTNADYTSDSAATVRGNSKGVLRKVEPSQNGVKLENPSPRFRLLRAKRRATGAEDTQGEESGISILGLDNAVDEEELRRLREQLDDEMDVLLKARMRDELQQTLGQPLTEVPIVLCALWRIDGWLWNLGSTLLMSASVTLAQGPLTDQIPRLFPPFHLVKTTLFVLIALHTLFTSIWTLALPTLGFAFVTYTSMLAGLGLCVAALGRWGLLV